MELTVLNEEGKASGKIEALDGIFKGPVNTNAIYEAIKNELANKRQGTHSTKTRAEVSGGNTKPWRQKGTGRARHGSRRSPIWVGGGKTHTPKPRDYSYDIPKKVKRLAFTSVFALKYGEDGVKIVEDFTFEKPTTKRMAKMIEKTKKEGARRIAFIVGNSDEIGAQYQRLLLSLRNIRDLKLVNADSLSIHPLYYADEIYITKSALIKMNSAMGKYLKG